MEMAYEDRTLMLGHVRHVESEAALVPMVDFAYVDTESGILSSCHFPFPML